MAEAITVTVGLGARSYPVLIGALGEAAVRQAIKETVGARRLIMVTDRNLMATRHRLLAMLGEEPPIVLAPGEQTKSFAELERLCGALLDRRIDRQSVLVAFGGGVIGDLVGFAAAILLRGLDFIQVPTTLLAQVDSSVGGKTAIDVPQGKNLVGAFHQPRLVLADQSVLESLPERELRAGYAEIVKYGLIGDAGLFGWLEGHGEDVLAGDPAARAHAVETSVRAKAAIVAADEREAGQRALLNLGHTFAHAYEQVAGYDGRLLHGEAVAFGMVQAARLSVRLGQCDPAIIPRITAHFAATGLMTAPPDWITATPERLLEVMAGDKKATGGQLTFILLREIGEAFIARDVDPGVVREVLDETA